MIWLILFIDISLYKKIKNTKKRKNKSGHVSAFRKDKEMIRYKIDVIEALRRKGISTTVASAAKLFPESTMKKFREDEEVTVSLISLDRLCYLLDMELEDIIEFVPDEETKEELMNRKNSVHIVMREPYHRHFTSVPLGKAKL